MTKAVTGTTGRPRRKRSRRSSVNGGDDLRHCAIEDRKALLRDLVGAAGCTRVVYVGHVRGIGRELFEAVRQVGGIPPVWAALPVSAGITDASMFD